MRTVRVAVAVLVATAAVACGAGEEDVVVEGTPPARPYAGPLHVPGRDTGEGGARAVRLASGAAGRALECDGEIYSGGAGGEWGEGDGGATQEEGLKAYFAREQPQEPRHGYRAEREEPGRVLYSFDVAGRTKVAVVVAEDRVGRPGWGPESSASCDPAELPASFTDSLDLDVWSDGHGNRIPVGTLAGRPGAEHCGWQHAYFLDLGRGEHRGQYVRDPGGVLDGTGLTGAYDGDARLPADARDTGYRLGERRLWLTDDPSRVYVRTSDGVEAWPRAREAIACK